MSANVPGDPIKSVQWRRIREMILLRDGYTCQIRGPKCTGGATSVDHIITREDGGEIFDPANLRASCKPCNSGRAAHALNMWRKYRVSVAQYETRM